LSAIFHVAIVGFGWSRGLIFMFKSRVSPTQADAASSPPIELGAGRLSPFRLFLLSVWCGLASGLLEVVTIVLRKTFERNHLYWTSRHFVWLIPLVNLLIFAALGGAFALAVRLSPRRGRWLATRFLCAITLLPIFLAAFPQIYGLAWLIVVLGIAARLVPLLERHGTRFAALVRLGFPVVALVPVVLAINSSGIDRFQEWRDRARPVSPAGSSSVILIVLDTVAADHLRLHGYDRATSPAIEEMAARGVRFDRAQATSSWTLPSHASMFTGRWPHELSASWLTPLDRSCLTLPEFLGSHGYATAGFTANYWYCASDSGLGRGFATYQDYFFPRWTALKTASLIDRPLVGIRELDRFLKDQLDLDFLGPLARQLTWQIQADRKGAAEVNREFLGWLSARAQPDRPFFAFLNYYDAHHPYRIPSLAVHRFGVNDDEDRESDPIQELLLAAQLGLSPEATAAARDSYDDCVANLDEQIGILMDELKRRAVLDRTWVIITADHGESFGEHAGIYRHGTSLYQTQLHVPLVIVPPAGGPATRVISETVSLRDLAATIADVLGLGAGSPFPGASLARFWNGQKGAAPRDPVAMGQALSEVVPLNALNPDPSQVLSHRWPLAALTSGNWTFIRREGEGDVREELFDLASDPSQKRNLANDPASQSTALRMRTELARLTAGPLTPERFRP
jgi:arylsulfatase A-like enzyme